VAKALAATDAGTTADVLAHPNNPAFDLPQDGHDTQQYKLLAASDATGGNGPDQLNGFVVGDYDATPSASRIDLAELLTGYKPANPDGPARYIDGVATIDAQDPITEYLSVTHSDGNTVIHIDRDGQAATYSATPLVTLNGVNTDLATLLANHQLVVEAH
jgi:hypothetical protein